MFKRKNQKLDKNREVERVDCKAEWSKAEDHVTEEIFCLLLKQGQKTR